MNTSSHLEKFERLRVLRAKLDPLEDFELWFWTTLTAGTNALNASLRLAGIGHGGRPPTDRLPEDILGLEQALATIERHRDPCVHGGRAPTRAIVSECEAAFAQVCRVLRSRCDWSLV